MTHDEYKDLLFLSASGEIDPDEKAVLERHLQTCDGCRKEYEDLRTLHGALIAHRVGIEPDERLLNEARQEFRIVLRNEVARRSAWFGWFDPGVIAPAARFALGAAFTLAVGLFLGRSLFPPAAVRGTPGSPHSPRREGCVQWRRRRGSPMSISSITGGEQVKLNSHLMPSRRSGCAGASTIPGYRRSSRMRC